MNLDKKLMEEIKSQGEDCNSTFDVEQQNHHYTQPNPSIQNSEVKQHVRVTSQWRDEDEDEDENDEGDQVITGSKEVG